MNKNAILLSLSFMVSGSAFSATGAAPDLTNIITATGECHDEDSLQISDAEGSRARFACLQNKGVQQKCDLDGRTARLNAFRQWMANLDAYQRQCDQRHGTFSFQAADFQEPKDESFCASPFINVTYGNFENPICTFVSRCPAVQVACAVNENSGGFHIPAQAVLMPGVPVAIPIN